MRWIDRDGRAIFHMARAYPRAYIDPMAEPKSDKTPAKPAAEPKVPDSIREDRATGAKEAARKNVETRKTVPEIGGADAPEPTRYGDWEFGGRCSDF